MPRKPWPRTDREKHAPTRTTGGYTVGVHDSAGSSYPMDFPRISEAREYARWALHEGDSPELPHRVTIHPNAWEAGGRLPAGHPGVTQPLETHYRKGARDLQADVHHGGDDLSHVFGQQDDEIAAWDDILKGAQSRVGNFRNVRR